jgi:hypothetical protein
MPRLDSLHAKFNNAARPARELGTPDLFMTLMF